MVADREAGLGGAFVSRRRGRRAPSCCPSPWGHRSQVSGGGLSRSSQAGVASLSANPATVRLLVVHVSRRAIAMRTGIPRRLGQIALIMAALPLVGWMLEEAAKRAEARKSGSASGRWLRQG